MPRALPLPLREQIVERHQQGETLKQISQTNHIPYHTVLACWRRYKLDGLQGLANHYDRCGPDGPKFSQGLIDQALALASYRGQARQLTAELIEAACLSYFIDNREASRSHT
jgi:hypothetical protein